MTDFDCYYEPLGAGRFRPSEATTSPWDSAAQHGGPPAALLAAEIERVVAAPAMRLVRITVEFLGAIPRVDLSVTTKVVRPGRRIQMSEAALIAGDRPAAIARAWHMVTGSPPPAGTHRPTHEVPPIPGPQPQQYFPGLTDWGYGEAVDWRFTQGGLDKVGPAGVWTRVRVPLIAGAPLTGLQRAMIVADAANGVSTELPLKEWWFIPPGLNVNFLRYPAGEWVHLQAETDVGTDGIGLCTGRLADPDGPVGQISQPLLVGPR